MTEGNFLDSANFGGVLQVSRTVQLLIFASTGLLNELLAIRALPDAALAAPIQSLVNDIQPRLGLMDYLPHREKGHAIGTGLMEASVKQLVGERRTGCGMHWSA